MKKKGDRPRNPYATVDIVIAVPKDGIVLIRRKNPPLGWALPGGFVDYGESCEDAAMREAREETSLEVTLIRQLGTYSSPTRDPRFHTLSVVYCAQSPENTQPIAADDAADAQIVAREDIPWEELCFDHGEILRDYFEGTGPATTLKRLNP